MGGSLIAKGNIVAKRMNDIGDIEGTMYSDDACGD